jgi:hypothetical protein
VRIPDAATLSALRQQYKQGTRIKLIEMPDDPCPIPEGTEGTVRYVDDAGFLQMDWDIQRSLAVIPDHDTFTVIQ